MITPGTGTAHPDKADLVTVHYTGWTTDGKMFDSSVSAGKEVTFPLDRVIAGWTEGVQLMVAGEKRRFWIPEALAYKGQQGRPKGMLVFDVELLKFTQSPTTAPADVKKAPADAKRTSSGLAYKVLTPGTGTQHPKSSSMVTVNYSGWTTEGKLFDSSLLQGKPISFRLDEVIRRVDGRRAADGRRREDPVLDSRAAGLQGPGPGQWRPGLRRRVDQDELERQR